MHRKRQASHSKTRPLFATPNRRHLTSARSRVNISIARKRRATREPRRARSRRGRALNSTILPQPAYRGASRRRGTQRSLGGRIFDAKPPRARAPRREPQKRNTPRAARGQAPLGAALAAPHPAFASQPAAAPGAFTLPANVPRRRPRCCCLRPIGATVARQIPVLKVTRSNRVSVTPVPRTRRRWYTHRHAATPSRRP